MENAERLAFARRLNEVCDEKEEIPPAYKGRQVELGKLLGVTANGARKWLQGEAYPSIDKCIEIARWAGVNFEWLMTGNGAKRPGELYPNRTIAHVAEVMQAMAPAQQSKAAQMVDILAQPAPANEHCPADTDKFTATGGQ